MLYIFYDDEEEASPKDKMKSLSFALPLGYWIQYSPWVQTEPHKAMEAATLSPSGLRVSINTLFLQVTPPLISSSLSMVVYSESGSLATLPSTIHLGFPKLLNLSINDSKLGCPVTQHKLSTVASDILLHLEMLEPDKTEEPWLAFSYPLGLTSCCDNRGRVRLCCASPAVLSLDGYSLHGN